MLPNFMRGIGITGPADYNELLGTRGLQSPFQDDALRPALSEARMWRQEAYEKGLEYGEHWSRLVEEQDIYRRRPTIDFMFDFDFVEGHWASRATTLSEPVFDYGPESGIRNPINYWIVAHIDELGLDKTWDYFALLDVWKELPAKDFIDIMNEAIRESGLSELATDAWRTAIAWLGLEKHLEYIFYSGIEDAMNRYEA